jgi:SAM-dependent methyltransferase
MEFLQLKNISERYLELVNPTTLEKILLAGQVAGMKKGSRVIDFGSGYAEALILWAEEFGISGLGIDIRFAACERARKKIQTLGLAEQIEIVCGDAAEYHFEAQSYDVACCVGATFIWKGGFQEAVGAMQQALAPGGRLIVGEAYWLHAAVPPQYSQRETSITTESELLHVVRAEGLELIYALHSSRDEWDHYESENWRGLSDWLDENPAHPAREDVIRHLHESQDEYVRYGREYLGWALYVLKPSTWNG